MERLADANHHEATDRSNGEMDLCPLARRIRHGVLVILEYERYIVGQKEGIAADGLGSKVLLYRHPLCESINQRHPSC